MRVDNENMVNEAVCKEGKSNEEKWKKENSEKFECEESISVMKAVDSRMDGGDVGNIVRGGGDGGEKRRGDEENNGDESAGDEGEKSSKAKGELKKQLELRKVMLLNI